MNRYIAVPSRLSANGKVPNEAVDLARVFHLEIRHVDDVDSVQIVSEPNILSVDYSPTYRPGYVWSLDITNEFVDMEKDPVLLINDVVHFPKIKEKHMLRFRPRLHCLGECDVTVKVAEVTLLSTTIDVEQ